MANTNAHPLTSCVLAAALVSLAHAPSAAAAPSARGPSMICVVEGMGSRVSEGTLCSKLERALGVTMVLRDDPWARDAGGTVRVIGGDVDVLVAVAWRKQRIAWARRSWMELGSNYVRILGMTVHELLPLPVVKQLRRAQRAKGGGYQPASIVRSEIIDPWVLSRMPVGAGLLPWEQESTRRASN